VYVINQSKVSPEDAIMPYQGSRLVELGISPDGVRSYAEGLKNDGTLSSFIPKIGEPWKR
jgi:hypothetical protein